MNYYTAEMVAESLKNKHYRDKFGESKLSVNDLKLALNIKQMNFQRPIPSSQIQNIAAQRNAIPLDDLVMGKQRVKTKA